jgi:hypothetical protein
MCAERHLAGTPYYDRPARRYPKVAQIVARNVAILRSLEESPISLGKGGSYALSRDRGSGPRVCQSFELKPDGPRPRNQAGER